MVKATNSRLSDDSGIERGADLRRSARWRISQLTANPLVVVVADVLAQETSQVLLGEFNECLLVSTSEEGRAHNEETESGSEAGRAWRARFCSVRRLSTRLILGSDLEYPRRLDGLLPGEKNSAVSLRTNTENRQDVVADLKRAGGG